MFKPHIQKLVRLQTSENRDIKRGILLDRNERVENYNEITYRKIDDLSFFTINYMCLVDFYNSPIPDLKSIFYSLMHNNYYMA